MARFPHVEPSHLAGSRHDARRRTRRRGVGRRKCRMARSGDLVRSGDVGRPHRTRGRGAPHLDGHRGSRHRADHPGAQGTAHDRRRRSSRRRRHRRRCPERPRGEPGPRSVEGRRRALALFCERARDADLRIVLETPSIMAVRTLRDAVTIVEQVDDPTAGVLIDVLHLIRSGGTTDDVAAVDPALLPYAQLCDVMATAPDDARGLLDEALHGRLLPGDGVAPIADLLRTLPAGCPLSLEMRSRLLWPISRPDGSGRSRCSKRHDGLDPWNRSPSIAWSCSGGIPNAEHLATDVREGRPHRWVRNRTATT